VILLKTIFWHGITRLGEALILLPAAGALVWWLARRARGQRMAVQWLLLVTLAALLTTATKVAFIGWGVGSAQFNFTGVSGHAMFATAVYPLLLRTAVSTASPYWHRAAILLGYLMALLIGISRVKVGAHSWSEVFAGWLVGGAASALALWLASVPRSPAPRWLLVGVVAWLIAMPLGAPKSPTHDWVTRLALAMSGREVPYTRRDLFREPPPATLRVSQRTSSDTPGAGTRPH
jgi:membrane-associated phospholipid phosphatase